MRGREGDPLRPARWESCLAAPPRRRRGSHRATTTVGHGCQDLRPPLLVPLAGSEARIGPVARELDAASVPALAASAPLTRRGPRSGRGGRPHRRASLPEPRPVGHAGELHCKSHGRPTACGSSTDNGKRWRSREERDGVGVGKGGR